MLYKFIWTKGALEDYDAGRTTKRLLAHTVSNVERPELTETWRRELRGAPYRFVPMSADELDGFIDRLTAPPRDLAIRYERFLAMRRGAIVQRWTVRDTDGTLLYLAASYERACSWAQEYARRLPGSSVDTSVEL